MQEAQAAESRHACVCGRGGGLAGAESTPVRRARANSTLQKHQHRVQPGTQWHSLQASNHAQRKSCESRAFTPNEHCPHCLSLVLRRTRHTGKTLGHNCV